MKKLYAVAFLLMSVMGWSQTINFPDANFKAKLLAANTSNSTALNASLEPIIIDTNGNGEIEVSEALLVHELTLNSSNIANLAGIENFANLFRLRCKYNQLTSLDVSALQGLFYLDCSYNSLTQLNFNGLQSLDELVCSHNALTVLNLEPLDALRLFDCAVNNITALNVSVCPI